MNGISLFLSIGPVHSRFKGCLVVLFIFIQIIIDFSVSKQWRLAIRRRILPCLDWLCTVCLCPKKRTLGLNGYMAVKFGVFVDEFHDKIPTVFLNFIKDNINHIFC